MCMCMGTYTHICKCAYTQVCVCLHRKIDVHTIGDVHISSVMRVQ